MYDALRRAAVWDLPVPSSLWPLSRRRDDPEPLMAHDASIGSGAAIGSRVTPCTARLSAPRPDPTEIPTRMPTATRLFRVLAWWSPKSTIWWNTSRPPGPLGLALSRHCAKASRAAGLRQNAP